MLYRHSYNYLTYGCLFFYIHDHNRLHFGNFLQNICLTCIMRINYDNILSSYTNEEVERYGFYITRSTKTNTTKL